MKQWQTESSARSDELAAKARNEGMDSLTPAEKQEWVNLRGAQSNFDGSINTLIYRAQMFGGSEETTTELANIFGHAAIANAAGSAAGISKAGKGSALPVPTATKSCMFLDARSAWERSDTTAQYCAGFFCSGSEVMFSPYSSYLKKFSTIVHPPFLPDHNELLATQELLYAVGVVTTRRSRSCGVSPR